MRSKKIQTPEEFWLQNPEIPTKIEATPIMHGETPSASQCPSHIAQPICCASQPPGRKIITPEDFWKKNPDLPKVIHPPSLILHKESSTILARDELSASEVYHELLFPTRAQEFPGMFYLLLFEDIIIHYVLLQFSAIFTVDFVSTVEKLNFQGTLAAQGDLSTELSCKAQEFPGMFMPTIFL